MSKITKKQLLKRLEVLEEWSNWADNMLNELNHALPDPEYDAKCEAEAVDVDASLARHHARLGLTKPKLKVLDQSVFDGLDEKWRFAAVDADGRALYFDKRPCGSDDITGNFVFKGDYQASFCGTGYDTTNWQNSLIERESELTGKELVGAMLDNGKNKVLVRVSSTSDKDIKRMILAFARKQNGEIVTNNGNTWEYMIAINVDDKPLTAKEAGL